MDGCITLMDYKMESHAFRFTKQLHSFHMREKLQFLRKP